MRQKPGMPFIILKHVTIRLYDRFILPDTFWEIKTNQNWVVLGQNGAGKTALVQALAGMAPIVRGSLTRHYDPDHPHPIGYVSFELHQDLITREERTADIQSMTKAPGPLTRVSDLILPTHTDETIDGSGLSEIAATFKIDHLLDREIITLSTGEMRKILVVRAVLKSPLMLVLDEPFDSLDTQSRVRLAETIQRLMQKGIQIILVTHRVEEVLPGITHILMIRDGRVQSRQIGDKTVLKHFFGDGARPLHPTFIKRGDIHRIETAGTEQLPDTLIRMNQVTVKYDDQPVIERLDWVVKPGEHWAITGPNGAGKTTLTALITGDHLQAYANKIDILGQTRGLGETIWEIKAGIGLVSSEFQIRYQKPLTGLETVISGFFDSVGLYRQATPKQQQTAYRWMLRLGIPHLSERRFEQLSFGEKRLVLLSRALVKSPVLLILDEPCQGLDLFNKQRFLELLNDVGQKGWSHLIYTTHHTDEMPGCITHVLNLTSDSETGYTIKRRCQYV